MSVATVESGVPVHYGETGNTLVMLTRLAFDFWKYGSFTHVHSQIRQSQVAKWGPRSPIVSVKTNMKIRIRNHASMRFLLLFFWIWYFLLFLYLKYRDEHEHSNSKSRFNNSFFTENSRRNCCGNTPQGCRTSLEGQLTPINGICPEL